MDIHKDPTSDDPKPTKENGALSTEIILRLRTNGLSVFAHQGVDLTISGNTGSHCGSHHRRLYASLIRWAPFLYFLFFFYYYVSYLLMRNIFSLYTANKQTDKHASDFFFFFFYCYFAPFLDVFNRKGDVVVLWLMSSNV